MPKSTEKTTSTEAAAPAASYAEATAELDAILSDLERDDLDVDVLAERVRRAAELLTWCRSRIRAASDEVDAAVAALSDGTGSGDGDPDAATPAQL